MYPAYFAAKTSTEKRMGVALSGKSSPVFDVRLYNNAGSIVRQSTTQNNIQLNVSNLPGGFYYLHVYDGANNSKPAIKRILIKH
jgi:hypothetical protein